jgi:anti-anti-sigma factor
LAHPSIARNIGSAARAARRSIGADLVVGSSIRVTVDLTWSKSGDCAIIKANGEIDLATVAPFENALTQSTGRAGAVIVDLSRVGFLGLVGVRCMSRAHTAAQKCGAAVHLVQPPNGPVVLIINASRLCEQLPVHADLQAALRSVK